MWKTTWNNPPDSHELYYAWTVYCRIWKDIGVQAPGYWIQLWMKLPIEEDAYYRGESIRHYVYECRE